MSYIEAPVFYPTKQDMEQGFEKYIESIEDKLCEVGIGQIIPPDDWRPTARDYKKIDVTIPR